MGRVVGIDLGTTNSVIAVMEGGKPIVIPNAEGMRTTPSVIGFTKEGELVVGQMARRQSLLYPQNTFSSIKRFMGRRYDELNSFSKQVSYSLAEDAESKRVKIKCPRLKKDFSPEELSAMILRRLVEDASRFLNEDIRQAVITVPAYFNDSQRQATRDAGKIAGIEVLRILNEPTAASLAYGLDQDRNQKILVFDLGGGTFDVSVLEIGEGVFEVRSTSGDTQLGGNDFDRHIVDWLANKFLEEEKIDLREDRQALQRLTEAAERAKIELSSVSVTDINLPYIAATEDGPKHIETRLTRSEFEEICGDLISRLRRPLKRALSDAGLSPVQINEVVLVGGATRMPFIKDLVGSFIDQEPNQTVNPDEVVAIGAAIQAGILGGEVKDILLLDVTPLSLGLETIGGVMKKLIPRNTTIPVRKSDIFSTSENNQNLVEVHILQGEREMSSGNKSLGRIKLAGIPPAPRGIPQIQVAFDIDANGILQVTARDKATGREQSIVVQGASSLSEIEVNRMMLEAEKFSSEDRERRERVEKRNRAKALTDQVQRRIKEVTLDFGSQFTSGYRRRSESISAEVLESLKKEDDLRLDRAQAELQDLLYELNREVRLQYEDEEDDGFLGTIKRTFIGDSKDDDYPPTSRRESYRNNDYPSTTRRESYRNNDYPSTTRRESYENDDYPSTIRRDPYDSEPSRYTQAPRNPLPNSDKKDPYSSQNPSYRSTNGRTRNIPPENNWDEEDDNWY